MGPNNAPAAAETPQTLHNTPEALHKTPRALQNYIERYFASCRGREARDRDGAPILGKDGTPLRIGAHPPTLTGLALWLGFPSQEALAAWKGDGEREAALLRARSRVEQYAEERLLAEGGFSGVKFSLMNNFPRWRDRPEGEPDQPALALPLAEKLALAEENRHETGAV